jgi:hypothetical protein
MTGATRLVTDNLELLLQSSEEVLASIGAMSPSDRAEVSAVASGSSALTRDQRRAARRACLRSAGSSGLVRWWIQRMGWFGGGSCSRLTKSCRRRSLESLSFSS